MRFLRISTITLIVCTTSAFAEDVKPKPPACGTTAEECQTKVDAANAQLNAAAKQLAIYRQLLTEANDRIAQQASVH